MEAIGQLIQEIQGAKSDRQKEIYAELENFCRGENDKEARSSIEKHARAQILTIQWELEELLERTAPAPVVEPEPEGTEEAVEQEDPPPPDPNAPLTAADVEVVYEDPRGLVLHRTKSGNRWLATQVDPRTGQPQTFELHPQEIDQLKGQLANSPYWVLGKEPV